MSLYPILPQQSKIGGRCPICLVDMSVHGTSRFACINGHYICHRCRPYYYSCPSCLQLLNEVSEQSFDSDELVTPISTLPYPMHLSQPYLPTAPNLQEFHAHEQETSSEGHQLIKCPYSYLGCTAEFLPSTIQSHISRCQYRCRNSNALTTQLGDDSELIACKYHYLGCNVRVPVWRLEYHEDICIYKGSNQNSGFVCDKHNREKFMMRHEPTSENQQLLECPYSHLGCTAKFVPSLSLMHISRCIYRNLTLDDPSTHSCDDSKLLACRYHYLGCNVNVPGWRMQNHEDICVYKNQQNQEGCKLETNKEPQLLQGSAYSHHDGTTNIESSLNDMHINECFSRRDSSNDHSKLVACKNHYLGCNVRVPVWRLQNHEDMCIYKDSNWYAKYAESQHYQEERIPCKYSSQGCNVRTDSYRLRDHEKICIYKNHCCN